MEAEAWKSRAGALSDWTWRNLVNRTDVWGAYAALDRREKGKSWTAPAKVKRGRLKLTPARVESHYAADAPEAVIGLHSTSPENTSRWCAIDIDAHEGKEADADANGKAAIQLYDFLLSLDVSPLLTDSNGKGGFHLRVIFDKPIPTDAAYHWIRQITQQCGAPVCEQFPKQSSITADGYGNWMRLPGRHHTTGHYSRVWDGEAWLNGDDAIDAILATRLNVAPEIDVPSVSRAEPSVEELYDGDELLDVAKQCVAALPDLDYEPWIRVGMALHRISAEHGLAIWDGWSKKGADYKDGECSRKWATFARVAGHKVGISTLLRYAADAGVAIKMPSADDEAMTWYQRSVISAPVDVPTTGVVSASPPPEGNDPKPIVYSTEGYRPTIANVEDYSFTANAGREIKACRHIPLPTIASAIWSTTGGWPVRAGGVLFVAEAAEAEIPDRRQITWISNDPSQLFAWLGHVADIRWTDKESESKQTAGATLNPPNKRELFHYIKDHSRNYRAVECLPHHPPLKDVYYLPHRLPEITETFSPLTELVGRFNCETELDRSLMLAALLTPGWGGPAGSRPAFVFSSEHGRGSGKTATASIFARIWGGCLSVSANEDWQKIRGRLLGDESLTTRVCLIDNMKGRKNDQDLEAMITSSVIDGWKPYHGDAKRPNLITWYLTSNSPSVSNDLAERSVVIRLGAQKHDKDFVGWAEAFIDEHRAEILSELFGFLRGEKRCDISARDRWVAWRNDILTLFTNGDDLARLIISRRSEVDSDREDAEMVGDVFKLLMTKNNFDPEKDNVFISSTQAYYALKRATVIHDDMGPKGCSTWLKDRCGVGSLSSLRWKKTESARGFLWIADRFNPQRYDNLPDDPADVYGWDKNHE